jgi:Caspase domain/Bacterial Ig domain
MKSQFVSRAKSFSAALMMLMTLGCATEPAVKMPESLPSSVKAYKQFTLWGKTVGLKSTGIHLNKLDVYTIMATGSLDLCSRGGCDARDVRPEHGWPLVARIGKGMLFSPLPRDYGGITMTALESGEIYLGYRGGELNPSGEPKRPEWYSDDAGSFSIAIIVWAKDDYQTIAAFLQQMKQKDPQNRAVSDALDQADRIGRAQLAAREASKEIEQTKKEIQSLKQAPVIPPKGPPEPVTPKPQADTSLTAKSPSASQPLSQGADKEQNLAKLEERLAKLTEQLAQFEAMKKQFEEERKKSEALAKELEQKQQAEQDLMIRLKDGSKNPPVIVIASPSAGSTVEVKIIHISGVAEDDEGLSKLEIIVNGKRVAVREGGAGTRQSKDAGAKRLDFKESIRLEAGENQITIRAMDLQGLASEKTLTVQYAERRKNIWAVVVGVNRYSKVRPLKYAVNDARMFYSHLVEFSQIPRENVTLLLDQDATLTRIRSTLGTHLKNKAGKEDMVIIFFAGHGATEKDVMSPDGDGLEKYLLPYDADPKDLYATAMPMAEVSRIFSRIQSERLIFIADSCYSGASGGRTIDVSGIRATISDAFLDRVAGGKGRVIITASGANEVSAEYDNIKQGVFTYYLVEGLNGKADRDKDGAITVDEVYQYVSEAVPRATNQEQHPVKKGTVEGQLILSIAK